MNKKYVITLAIVIFALCLMMIPVILLSGCAAEPSKEATLPTPEFTTPVEYGLNFIIDNNSHIVYIYDDSSYGGGVSPYYLLDENNVPHMVKWENNEFVLLPNS
jgi:hypothetical protein